GDEGLVHALFPYLAYEHAGLAVQPAEEDGIDTGAADAGDQGVVVAFAAIDAIEQRDLHTQLLDRFPGGVSQSAAIGVPVVDHRESRGLELVCDEIGQYGSLLVVTSDDARDRR